MLPIQLRLATRLRQPYVGEVGALLCRCVRFLKLNVSLTFMRRLIKQTGSSRRIPMEVIRHDGCQCASLGWI